MDDRTVDLDWTFRDDESAIGPLRVPLKRKDPYAQQCQDYVEQAREKIFEGE